MFRLYLSHFQALKDQIQTISEQCIVGSPPLTIIHHLVIVTPTGDSLVLLSFWHILSEINLIIVSY
jgi:hypothetical protein